MKQAYCSECRAYVLLDDAGSCPGGHSRPCYRDIREADPVSTPPLSLSRPTPSAATATAWGGRTYERRPSEPTRMAFMAVALGAMVVGFIIYFHLQVVSLWSFAPAVYFGWAALRQAQHPYAIASSTGIVLWQSPWQPVVLEWRDVVRCRRAGRLTRIDTRGGQTVDLYVSGVRPDRQEEFSIECGNHLGSLWTGAEADDPQLVRELRVQQWRTTGVLLVVALILAAVAVGEYWVLHHGLVLPK